MTRVVLADDHAFLRAGVEAMLRRLGLEVVASVGDGVAALAAIAREDPDLCIFDVRMPELSGVKALAALRERGDMRPVILLTAELDDAALTGALAAKVNGIVAKDGAESALEAAIRQVLAGERFIAFDVMDRAFALATASQGASRLEALTPREMAIARAVVDGKRNKVIADEIGTTEGMVKLTLHRIYLKLEVANRTELAVMMANAGI